MSSNSSQGQAFQESQERGQFCWAVGLQQGRDSLGAGGPPRWGALAWLSELGLLGTPGDILTLDIGGGLASHLSRG